jgi:hypothetical protein
MLLIKKIRRPLSVLGAAVILGILVWIFAAGTEFIYHGITASVLILMGVTFAIYYSPKSITKELAKKAELASYIRERLEAENAKKFPESENLVVEPSLGGTRYPGPAKPEPGPVPGRRSIDNLISFRSAPALRQDAKEVAARYFQMAKKENGAKQTANVILVKPAQPKIEMTPLGEAKKETVSAVGPEKKTGSGKPSTYLREDETTLKDEEKNELINSVWCTCENPYCKFTKFLDVHHVVDEKDGGSNRLDNLIVLCSFCHDLAHKDDIPLEEMRGWIATREQRYQFKPNWHYH